VGLGEPFTRLLDAYSVAGLRSFPGVTGPGCAFPSTQAAVWVYTRGADPGVCFEAAHPLRRALGDLVRVQEEVATFTFRGGRDLSGYEDGTENPKGDAALAAAFVSGQGPGLDGASFVAAQAWVHDLPRVARMKAKERDHLIGRSMRTNEELDDAPPSAHVKRTAQESFDPPAFMLRRSMPWGGVDRNGLYFVAYGADLDRFERSLRRMAGLEDGVTDGILQMSRAISGGYYWCPPVHEGQLDLRAVGL